MQEVRYQDPNCCQGYKITKTKQVCVDGMCKRIVEDCGPSCEPSCCEGMCVATNTCKCYAGYIKDKSGRCVPQGQDFYMDTYVRRCEYIDKVENFALYFDILDVKRLLKELRP